MDILLEALRDALALLLAGDRELLSVIGLTVRVSGTALLLAIVFGVPLGAVIGLSQRRWTRVLVPIVYTGMGLPPVLVGLFVYIFLSNQGVLGDLRWLFTPQAMIMAQTIIAWPLIIGLTATAVQSIDPMLPLQLQSLGATRWQLAMAMLAESRLGLFAAIVAAFGRVIAEVGAVILVGGNIEGETRVLTTAIVLETRRGNFALAIALGVILLGLSLVANVVLYRLQQRK